MVTTTSNQSVSSWFSYRKPKPSAKLRLFCLPYAGGSALIYRTWGSRISANVEVCPVSLPGRAPRATEPCFQRLAPMAEATANALLPYCDKPFAVFGHSMGAMLSFEIARYLRRHGHKGPSQVFVSGRRAPQVPDEDPPTYDLPYDEFIAELKRINGTPAEILEHEEILEMVVPIIRADFEACQTYQYTPEPPLDCPIMAFGGATDDEETEERIKPWQEQTTASFSVSMLPGDHFFLHTSEDLLLQLLDRQLHKLVQRLSY